jgi:hypothetical protein
MIQVVTVIVGDVIVAVEMIRLMGASILLIMAYCIIAQIAEDLKEIQVEDGVDELVEQYCKEINTILLARTQVIEQ